MSFGAVFLTVVAMASGALADGQRPAQVPTVRVAAASDLKFALDEVAARLARRSPSIKVEPVYGSSGNFHAQLQQRAPFDLYLSADVEYPRDLVRNGIGAERDLFVYAVGQLVVWVRASSTLPVERDGIRALTRARRIAIANPRHAPYGRAAEQAMRNAGIWDQVQRRLVLGENVAQAAQFVQSGAADAGVIAKSLAVAPAMHHVGKYSEVPIDQHELLVQGGLVLPWAKSRDAAMHVRDYLLSEEGRQLLASFGFGPVVSRRTGRSS